MAALRLRWPVRRAVIEQRFGEHPELYGRFGLPGHEGVDLRASTHDAVLAAADGMVSDVRLDAFADPLVKPYGNQIRLQHMGGYETLYAHLSQVVVVRGQVVHAGDVIGLAGDTGFTRGVHVHFGLKCHGATLRGDTHFPYDLIDPEPFVMTSDDEDHIPTAATTELVVDVREASDDAPSLNVRMLPYVGSPVVGQVHSGERLEALEDPWAVAAKVGRRGQWLWVRTAGGALGWVAAWYVRPEEGGEVKLPSTAQVIFVVVSTDGERLRLRRSPATDAQVIRCLPPGTWLRALEEEETLRAKVGQWGTWLRVQDPLGEEGFCAAWFLKLEPGMQGRVLPDPHQGEPTSWVRVNAPGAGLRVREGPGTHYKRIWWVPHDTVLRSLEDPEETGQKVGRRGKWIHVRTPSQHEGYVAAWYVRHPGEGEKEDKRAPAPTGPMRTGLCPYIFGVHAVSVADEVYDRQRIRDLFESQHKRGWILFTEICGRHPHTIQLIPEIRRRLWDWADRGYGVIIRLNHGYEPGGTLPESRYYDDFAAAAARWVEVYLRDAGRSPLDYTWTIQIGNEQNNPREHPGGSEHPVEHITPEMYADAFNRTYVAIKRVLPNAIVCPGAIDPYNYMPMRRLGGVRWRPLDYFTSMLSHIEELDGIVLHAYTHGPDPAMVTHLKRFGNGSGPLGDHYYDFQVYRLFMERIPAQWHHVPVYITEMNPLHRPSGEHDLGWVNRNLGWVRAVYDEIHRWNAQPYAQQIRCGLLYRWRGDAWAIEDKGEVLRDFVESLAHDYRWRDRPAQVAFDLSLPDPPFERPEERQLVEPDDFTRLWGLDEEIQAVLRAAGIMLYEQLAQLAPSELEAIIGETELRPRLLSTWPEQAQLAAAGAWARLTRYRYHRGGYT